MKNCITINKSIISRKKHFKSQKYRKLFAVITYVMYKWYEYSIAICNNNTEDVYMLQIHLELKRSSAKAPCEVSEILSFEWFEFPPGDYNVHK